MYVVPIVVYMFIKEYGDRLLGGDKKLMKICYNAWVIFVRFLIGSNSTIQR